jgi:hypothetical protein
MEEYIGVLVSRKHVVIRAESQEKAHERMCNMSSDEWGDEELELYVSPYEGDEENSL